MDEEREALERVGIEPGDVVVTTASSQLPLFPVLDTSSLRNLGYTANEWIRPGEIALVLALALSRDDASQARPAVLLLVMSERKALGWSRDVASLEAWA